MDCGVVGAADAFAGFAVDCVATTADSFGFEIPDAGGELAACGAGSWAGARRRLLGGGGGVAAGSAWRVQRLFPAVSSADSRWWQYRWCPVQRRSGAVSRYDREAGAVPR